MPETPEGRRGAQPSLTSSVTRPITPNGQAEGGGEGPADDEDTGIHRASPEAESDTLPPGAVELAAAGSAAPVAASPLIDVLAQATREAEATREPRRAADLWA